MRRRGQVSWSVLTVVRRHPSFPVSRPSRCVTSSCNRDRRSMVPPMENAMVCHIAEGELQVEQDGKTFTAKKNFVWTCNKNTKEQSSNVSNAVAIMRITALMP